MKKAKHGGAAATAKAPLAVAAPGAAAAPFLSAAADGVRIRVHAVPRASRTECAGMQGDCLKVRVQAVPEDGKANAALVEWLAGLLCVPKRDVAVVSGLSSREKVVSARGCGVEAALRALAPAIASQPKRQNP